MDHIVCPGSRTMRQPVPEMFQCPTCGEEVEIWSDEIKGSCLKCGTTVMRDGFMSCLDWCAMGKDCVGDATYGKYMNNKAESIKKQADRICYGQNKPRCFRADLHYSETRRATL